MQLHQPGASLASITCGKWLTLWHKRGGEKSEIVRTRGVAATFENDIAVGLLHPIRWMTEHGRSLSSLSVYM